MDGETDPETLREALDDEGSPLIVDIRSPAHFAEGHIPESQNVPLPEIPQSIESIAEADHVVTVCPHGKASVKAARIVGAYRDFDGRVESLAGGLEAWDGPLEPDGVDSDGTGSGATGPDRMNPGDPGSDDPGSDGPGSGDPGSDDPGSDGPPAPF